MAAYICYVILIVVMVAKESMPLLCWRCSVVGGEDECTKRGRPETCHKNQACLTELREENQQTSLIRSCKQRLSCYVLRQDNLLTCNKNRFGLQRSICYDCCTDRNYCNALHNDPNRGEPFKADAKPSISSHPVTSTEYSSSKLSTETNNHKSQCRDSTKSPKPFFREMTQTTQSTDEERVHNNVLSTEASSEKHSIEGTFKVSTTKPSTIESNFLGGLLIVEPDYFEKSNG